LVPALAAQYVNCLSQGYVYIPTGPPPARPLSLKESSCPRFYGRMIIAGFV
jgi:hypothetical protein